MDAADRFHRHWVGIDISPVALNLVIERKKDDQGVFENIKPRSDCPNRTDIANLIPYNHPKNKKQLDGEQGVSATGANSTFKFRT